VERALCWQAVFYPPERGGYGGVSIAVATVVEAGVGVGVSAQANAQGAALSAVASHACLALNSAGLKGVSLQANAFAAAALTLLCATCLVLTSPQKSRAPHAGQEYTKCHKKTFAVHAFKITF
jgi:hypothetical protein